MKILKSDFPGLAELLMHHLGLSKRSLYERGDFFYFQFHDLLKRNQFDWKELDMDTRDALSYMGMVFSDDGSAIGEKIELWTLAKNIKADHLREHAKLRSEIWKEAARKTQLQKKIEFQEIIAKNIESANAKLQKAVKLADPNSINLVKAKTFEIIEFLLKNEKITVEHQSRAQKIINVAYQQLHEAIQSKDPKKINIAEKGVFSVNNKINFQFFISPIKIQEVRTAKSLSSVTNIVPKNPKDKIKSEYLETPKKSHHTIKPAPTKNPGFTPSKNAISKQKTTTPTPPAELAEPTKRTNPIPALSIKTHNLNNNPPVGIPITPTGSSTPPRRAG